MEMKTLTFFLLTLFAIQSAVFSEPESSVAFGGIHSRISPDGKSIAVSYQGAIWRMDIDSGKLSRMTQGEGWDIEPAWSPDGKALVYINTSHLVTGVLKMMDSETGKDIPLPKRIIAQGRLTFSPDGKQIFGLMTEANTRRFPSWLNVETGELTALSLGPEDPARFSRKGPKFTTSTDGSKIIYAIHRDEPDEQSGNRGPQADVWQCRADGSEPEQLFTWPARIYDISPMMDDSGILVSTDLGVAHNDIWQIPFSAPLKNAERLTSSHADDEKASLSADGKLLAWSDNSSGATSVKLRDLEAGTSRDLAVKSFDFREKIAPVTIKLGPPLTNARASVKRKDGKFFFPSGSLYRLTGGAGHFYLSQSATLDLPVGEYEITLSGGPESIINRETISIEGPQAKLVPMSLYNWSNRKAARWFSGENHVHANYGYGEWYNRPQDILEQCRAEQLNVCNAVIGNSDGEAIFDRELFLGQIDPRSTDDNIIYWGQEFRSTIWGHMTLSNLSRLVEPIMTGFDGTTNPFDVPTNADIAQRTIDQGGLIGYTHPAGNRLDLYNQPYASKGLPIDAALGRVALMDVHGHTYAGSLQLWYRLMNCGLKVYASSGTDVFLNRIRSFPPGWARTYVYLPEGLSYEGWTEGQAAGRSFITNGPMIEFEVDGKLAGSTITLNRKGTVEVTAMAEWQFPLEKIELVFNGKVIREIPVKEGDAIVSTGSYGDFRGGIEVTESGWLAVRASAPDHPGTIRTPGAHSNPVWIEVNDTKNSSAKNDAAFFLKWIDRLEGDLKKRDRIPNERLWNHVRSQLDGARDYYRKEME